MNRPLMSLEDRLQDACTRAVVAEQDRALIGGLNQECAGRLQEGRAVVLALLAMLPGLPEQSEAEGLANRARAWLAAIG